MWRRMISIIGDSWKMKAKNIISISIALLAMAFTACQREELDGGTCTVRMVPRVAEHIIVTRDYQSLAAAQMHDFEAGIIVDNGAAVMKEAKLRYQGGKAELLMMLEASRYHVYGYMPWREDAEYTRATDGATISVPSLPGLSSTMATVVRPTTLEIKQGEKDDVKTLALQMDHLSAKVTPCLYLHDEYAKLRTIHIKKIEFILDEAQSRDLLITYSNDGYSVEWQDPTAGPARVAVTAFSDASTYDMLSTVRGEQAYGACYINPEQSVENLKMRVTYDVYDKVEGDDKYSITRPDVVVTNTIKQLGKGSEFKLTAGTNYVLNIKVMPTYLYSLSDNDEQTLLIVD